MESKDHYQLVQKDFLDQYKFDKFPGKWHLDLYMDNEKIGALLFEDFDKLMHALKKTNQFVHFNVQKFIEKTGIHAQKLVDSNNNPKNETWKIEGNIFLHAMKEILLLENELYEVKGTDAFFSFKEIYDNLNIKNTLDHNPNPVFVFKMIWGF